MLDLISSTSLSWVQQMRETRNYKRFITPPEFYDTVGALQFCVLRNLGLRENHYLLDIGCGSLRGGKLFIPYLLPNRYYGIEPEQWLIDEAIDKELGRDMVRIRQPTFSNDSNFTLSIFHQEFDYLLAQSIFIHAAERQIRRCLAEARKVMKPEALFAANYSVGKENYGGDEWSYPNAVKYTREYMASMIEDAGLVCRCVNCSHPGGHEWIVITRR